MEFGAWRKPVARLVLIGVVLLPLLAGCAAASGRYQPVVDAMFRPTGKGADVSLELSQPSLVNELNGAFTLGSVAWLDHAALNESGRVQSGENAVLMIEFADHGGIDVLRTDDTVVSFRAELGPEGKVIRALLGGEGGRITDGFVSYTNDVFREGSWRAIYDGPDLVIGRIDIEFEKYTAAVNFRVPR